MRVPSTLERRCDACDRMIEWEAEYAGRDGETPVYSAESHDDKHGRACLGGLFCVKAENLLNDSLNRA